MSRPSATALIALPLLAVLPTGCGSDEAVGDANDPPAGKPIHRMNKVEWSQTLQDLLGIQQDVTEHFPTDPTTFGFDNIAAGVTTSPVHVELLEGAIDAALDQFFQRDVAAFQRSFFEAESDDVLYTGGGPYEDWAYLLEHPDHVAHSVYEAPARGSYELTLFVFAIHEQAQPPTLIIDVNGRTQAELPLVTSHLDARQALLATLELEAGPNAIDIRFDAEIGAADFAFDVLLDAWNLAGPIGNGTPSASPRTADILLCAPETDDDAACAHDILEEFGRRAWRRPLTDSEVSSFDALFEVGLTADLTWDEALQLAMKGILFSPEFSFREEQTASPESARRLNGYELASRLSYFLWSSMPDDSLLAAADNDALLDPDVLHWHTERMLDDERSDALPNNFAGQWWGIRTLQGVQPDTTLYGNWSEDLRASMTQEMLELARHHLFSDGDFRDFINAKEGWLDPVLASHYQMPAANGWSSLDGTARQGLLTTAGWLTVNASPAEPSAVKRGKWVLDNLLCAAPPPPPPEAQASIPPEPDEGSARTREEAVRSGAFCQGCHAEMDAIGFSLGHFDALGGFRSIDEFGYPIDAITQLPTGDSIRAASGLIPMLRDDERVARCIVEKTFAYANGRAPGVADERSIDEIATAFVAGGASFRALARAIVQHPTFQERGPVPPDTIAEAP